LRRCRNMVGRRSQSLACPTLRWSSLRELMTDDDAYTEVSVIRSVKQLRSRLGYQAAIALAAQSCRQWHPPNLTRRPAGWDKAGFRPPALKKPRWSRPTIPCLRHFCGWARLVDVGSPLPRTLSRPSHWRATESFNTVSFNTVPASGIQKPIAPSAGRAARPAERAAVIHCGRSTRSPFEDACRREREGPAGHQRHRIVAVHWLVVPGEILGTE
jgi:hypothetical protein